MTKLEKIDEIIREWRDSGDISAEEVIDSIEGVIAENNRDYDQEFYEERYAEYIKDALKAATYQRIIHPEDTFNRYDVIFHDGIVPTELKEKCDVTDIAEKHNLHFLSYPDDDLVVHLKDYDYKAILSVTLKNSKGPLYTVDVTVNPAYLDMIHDKIKEDAKEQKGLKKWIR